MNQYFLKFENEAEAANLINESAEIGDTLNKDGMTIHIVGDITKQIDTGQVDAEGEKIYETQTISGYHINVLAGELPAEFGQYRIMPNKPYRVFAGA